MGWWTTVTFGTDQAAGQPVGGPLTEQPHQQAGGEVFD
jgi:hypothetical protein